MMGQKHGNNIGVKVVIGYIVLIIIAICSVGYIYNVVKEIAAEEDDNSIPRQKIYLITNTLSLLYESETMGQLLDMEDEEFSYFNETLDRAKVNMDSLRLLLTDSLQLHKIDTIDVLIEQKRTNTTELLNTWRRVNSDLYARNIQQALSNKIQDVKETEIKERTSIKQDTVIVTATKRKNFFKRLAEVFVPEEHKDTSIIVTANQEVVKDSLVNTYNPQDAISKTLRSIQSNVENERKQLRELLVDNSAALRFDNSLISTEINSILRSIEEEELNASFNRIQRRQDLLGDTSLLISALAIVSLLVAVFFLVLIRRDLFKSKYYRKQLEKEKRYTEDLLQSREKLILTISHDIRAPLSSIIGYIELLQRSVPGTQQKMYLNNMSGSSNHILSLVNDLLDYQRLDAGQIELHDVPFRVPTLFQEIFNSFQPQAKAKDLELVLTMQGETDCVYESDAVRIRQIVTNLLTNALKFTDEGSVEIVIDCTNLIDSVAIPLENPEEEEATEGETAPVQPPASQLIIAVKDTGRGIPESEQERIFAEFTRLEGAEKTEGFGLGLSITHKLVALLQGTIRLESTPGEGSCFTVEIPLALSDNQQFMETKAEEPAQPGSFKDRRISCLIIDDDLMQIALMEEIMKQHDIQVISCANPRAVMDLLRKETVDLVLSDIQMPGMDGYDIVRQIRSSDLPHAKTLPVIALSATVGRDRRRYQEAGFTDCLSKPFATDELFKLLDRLVPETREARPAPKKTNISSLTAFAGDDKAASQHILRTFSEETGKSVALLKEALATADKEAAARTAHKLIPVFTMLGAQILVQQLRILERTDVELSYSAWQRLLSDAIEQAESTISDVEAESKIGLS